MQEAVDELAQDAVRHRALPFEKCTVIGIEEIGDEGELEGLSVDDGVALLHRCAGGFSSGDISVEVFHDTDVLGAFVLHGGSLLRV